MRNIICEHLQKVFNYQFLILFEIKVLVLLRFELSSITFILNERIYDKFHKVDQLFHQIAWKLNTHNNMVFSIILSFEGFENFGSVKLETFYFLLQVINFFINYL